MSLTLFIADDHEVVRAGLASLLAGQADFRIVGTASDGQQAVREVLRLQPDVLIMDITMPIMNGMEGALELRRRESQTKIIILSMHASVEHVFRALEAGANGYVLKDAVAQDIIEAVRVVRAGRRYFSPRVTELLADNVARSGAQSPLESLSRRERQVLQLVTEGRSSAQIAELLSLSPKSVDTYRSRLMQKLRIHDIAGLVKFSIQHGLTTLD